ncbi:MAG: low-specificity L-threonine aldolase [Gammaproteobacteria bacterium]|nr:low-specificity L-threonine aldolase [Gammaproteobacteria bacterium]
MIDVRSDTVTRPDDAMRQAMANAAVGDDVYGDDPTVNQLQTMVAERMGHDKGLFFPTGTQCNLAALLTHCQRGDEYIVGGDAHTYKYEGGGAAALGGIQPQTVPFGDNGLVPLEQVSAVIKEDDVHFARTRLLCLENTQHGRVQSLETMQAARTFCTEKNLQIHLDGARVANAAVKLNIELEAIGACFDSVSICLSKGLGAPVGSVLTGDAAFIEEAHRWRKVTGGGMRQSGVLAAAGILEIERMHELAHDHHRALDLASRLTGLSGVSVREGWTQTNMVWLDYDGDHSVSLPTFAKQRGVLMSVRRNAGRLVLHRDVSDTDLDVIEQVFKDYFSA